jgi:electron transport complex protein RnfE
MFGPGARDFALSLGDSFQGALLAILPPGAFLGLGLLIALKKVIDRRVEQRREARATAVSGAGEAAAGG